MYFSKKVVKFKPSTILGTKIQSGQHKNQDLLQHISHQVYQPKYISNKKHQSHSLYINQYNNKENKPSQFGLQNKCVPSRQQALLQKIKRRRINISQHSQTPSFKTIQICTELKASIKQNENIKLSHVQFCQKTSEKKQLFQRDLQNLFKRCKSFSWNSQSNLAKVQSFAAIRRKQNQQSYQNIPQIKEDQQKDQQNQIKTIEEYNNKIKQLEAREFILISQLRLTASKNVQTNHQLSLLQQQNKQLKQQITAVQLSNAQLRDSINSYQNNQSSSRFVLSFSGDFKKNLRSKLSTQSSPRNSIDQLVFKLAQQHQKTQQNAKQLQKYKQLYQQLRQQLQQKETKSQFYQQQIMNLKDFIDKTKVNNKSLLTQIRNLTNEKKELEDALAEVREQFQEYKFKIQQQNKKKNGKKFFELPLEIIPSQSQISQAYDNKQPAAQNAQWFKIVCDVFDINYQQKCSKQNLMKKVIGYQNKLLRTTQKLCVLQQKVLFLQKQQQCLLSQHTKHTKQHSKRNSTQLLNKRKSRTQLLNLHVNKNTYDSKDIDNSF